MSIIQTDPRVSAAIITAAVALLAALFSYAVAKNSSFITAVTAERSKWIDKLRENIANLLGVCGAIHLMKDRTTSEAYLAFEKADRLIALIQMQLNPDGEIDKNILALLRPLTDAAQRDGGVYRSLEKKFIRHTQFLLKEEWETVKREAMGRLMWNLLGNDCKDCKRKCGYRQFLKEQ